MTMPTRAMRGLRFCASALKVGDAMLLFRTKVVLPLNMLNTSTMSTQGPGAVNARDRIGNDPWLNSRGQRVAMNVADLHGDAIESARLGNNISKATAFTEKNETIMGFGDTTNQHDILTGSQPDGRAYTDAMDHTCNNYTSSSDARGSAVQLGHFDRTGGGNTSWNSAHASRGCSQQALIGTGGAGLLYCFAN